MSSSVNKTPASSVTIEVLPDAPGGPSTALVPVSTALVPASKVAHPVTTATGTASKERTYFPLFNKAKGCLTGSSNLKFYVSIIPVLALAILALVVDVLCSPVRAVSNFFADRKTAKLATQRREHARTMELEAKRDSGKTLTAEESQENKRLQESLNASVGTNKRRVFPQPTTLGQLAVKPLTDLAEGVTDAPRAGTILGGTPTVDKKGVVRIPQQETLERSTPAPKTVAALAVADAKAATAVLDPAGRLTQSTNNALTATDKFLVKDREVVAKTAQPKDLVPLIREFEAAIKALAATVVESALVIGFDKAHAQVVEQIENATTLFSIGEGDIEAYVGDVKSLMLEGVKYEIASVLVQEKAGIHLKVGPGLNDSLAGLAKPMIVEKAKAEAAADLSNMVANLEERIANAQKGKGCLTLVEAEEIRKELAAELKMATLVAGVKGSMAKQPGAKVADIVAPAVAAKLMTQAQAQQIEVELAKEQVQAQLSNEFPKALEQLEKMLTSQKVRLMQAGVQLRNIYVGKVGAAEVEKLILQNRLLSELTVQNEQAFAGLKDAGEASLAELTVLMGEIDKAAVKIASQVLSITKGVENAEKFDIAIPDALEAKIDELNDFNAEVLALAEKLRGATSKLALNEAPVAAPAKAAPAPAKAAPAPAKAASSSVVSKLRGYGSSLYNFGSRIFSAAEGAAVDDEIARRAAAPIVEGGVAAVPGQ